MYRILPIFGTARYCAALSELCGHRTSTPRKHPCCFHSYRAKVEQNWSLNDKRLSKNLIPLWVHRWTAQSDSAASAAFESTTQQFLGSLHCISSRMTPVDQDWQIGTKTTRSQDEQLKKEKVIRLAKRWLTILKASRRWRILQLTSDHCDERLQESGN